MTEPQIYENVSISDALTPAQVAVLKPLDLSAGTHSAGSLTISGTSYDVTAITGDVVAVTDTPGFADLDSTTIGDEAQNGVQGRGTHELRIDFFPNNADDGAWEKLVEEMAGTKLVYIERGGSKKLIAMVYCNGVNVPPVEDTGRQVCEATFRNSGGMTPKWS